jgi:hypothetical protein
MTGRPILALLAALAAAPAAQAAVVSADGASATSFFSSGYAPGLTIDGSGLSTPGDPSATHSIYTAGNHWTSSGGDPTN